MRNTMLAALMVAAGSMASPAMACGDGMLMAVLFLKHPEARTVYEAARRDDVVENPMSATATPQQHAASVLRTKLAAHMLKRRFLDLQSATAGEKAISLFLAEEGQLVTLSSTQGETAMMSDVDVYTTASALRALLTGRLDWAKAEAERLAVIVEGRDPDARVSQVMNQLFEPSRDLL